MTLLKLKITCFTRGENDFGKLHIGCATVPVITIRLKDTCLWFVLTCEH